MKGGITAGDWKDVSKIFEDAGLDMDNCGFRWHEQRDRWEAVRIDTGENVCVFLPKVGWTEV
jgi:hypothetical protein